VEAQAESENAGRGIHFLRSVRVATPAIEHRCILSYKPPRSQHHHIAFAVDVV
jgi:hypothetical protein